MLEDELVEPRRARRCEGICGPPRAPTSPSSSELALSGLGRERAARRRDRGARGAAEVEGRRRPHALRGPPRRGLASRCDLAALARISSSACSRHAAARVSRATPARGKWAAELLWRDWFKYVLHHHPDLAERAGRPALRARAVARRRRATSRPGAVARRDSGSWMRGCASSPRWATSRTACAWSAPASCASTCTSTGGAASAGTARTSSTATCRRTPAAGSGWRAPASTRRPTSAS